MKKVLAPIIVLLALIGVYVVMKGGRSEKVTGDASSSAVRPMRIAYVEWDDAVAATYVIKQVLEQRLHHKAEVTSVSAAAMWEAVATGDVDAMVAAWLPVTHADYLAKYKNDVVDLGPNLEGAKIGLVVPDYVTIGSIAQLKENAGRFDGRIVGIDPGAGIMRKTEKAIEAYNLDKLQLVNSSGAVMAAELGQAIKKKQWIVVTGWTPHWMFARWQLKYLDDPKGVYGGAEAVHTIVRKGLQTDMPKVCALLAHFKWTTQQIAKVMSANRAEDADPNEVAAQWVKTHGDVVDQWVK